MVFVGPPGARPGLSVWGETQTLGCEAGGVDREVLSTVTSGTSKAFWFVSDDVLAGFRVLV